MVNKGGARVPRQNRDNSPGHAHAAAAMEVQRRRHTAVMRGVVCPALHDGARRLARPLPQPCAGHAGCRREARGAAARAAGLAAGLGAAGAVAGAARLVHLRAHRRGAVAVAPGPGIRARRGAGARELPGAVGGRAVLAGLGQHGPLRRGHHRAEPRAGAAVRAGAARGGVADVPGADAAGIADDGAPGGGGGAVHLHLPARRRADRPLLGLGGAGRGQLARRPGAGAAVHHGGHGLEEHGLLHALLPGRPRRRAAGAARRGLVGRERRRGSGCGT